MDPPVAFFCASCGVRLSVSREMAGIAAPCPRCGAFVTSPSGEAAAPPMQGILLAEESRGGRRRRSGRVIPDAGIDREELDRRETVHTMKVVAWIVAAVCACLAVTWLLQEWAMK